MTTDMTKPDSVSIVMTNDVIEQLKLFGCDCVLKRNRYWGLHYQFSRLNNYVSIPLLLLSSLTGLTSVSQASSTSANEANMGLLWATAAMGTTSTFLAAMQRYFRYGERAEHCRSLAKSYGDLVSRIEITLDLYRSGAKADWTIVELGKFAEDVVQEMRKLLNDTQDVPVDMLYKEVSFASAPSPK